MNKYNDYYCYEDWIVNKGWYKSANFIIYSNGVYEVYYDTIDKSFDYYIEVNNNTDYKTITREDLKLEIRRRNSKLGKLLY